MITPHHPSPLRYGERPCRAEPWLQAAAYRGAILLCGAVDPERMFPDQKRAERLADAPARFPDHINRNATGHWIERETPAFSVAPETEERA